MSSPALKTPFVNCDVLVVGGGVAGIGAAITAARNGAHTILVEQNDFLGGVAIAGLHQFICGLYLNSPDPPKILLNEGLWVNVLDQLKKYDPNSSPRALGKVFVHPFKTKHFTAVINQLCHQTPLLNIHLNTHVDSVTKTDNQITQVDITHPHIRVKIIPQKVIDCSGQAIVSQLANLDVSSPDAKKQQLAGFCAVIDNLKDPSQLLHLKLPLLLKKAVDKKKCPSYIKFTTIHFDPRTNVGTLKTNLPPGTSAIAAIKRMEDVFKYLKSNLGEFESAQLSRLSPYPCEREDSRFIGGYTLTSQDVLQGKKFDDGVVKNAWPIEIWSADKGVQYKYLPPNAYYEIPLSCTTSPYIRNLLCAGKCISVTAEALGSTRVMGPCLSLGEQAAREALRRMNF